MCGEKETKIRVLRNTAAIEYELRLREVLTAIELEDLHLVAIGQSCPNCSVDDAGPVNPHIKLSDIVAIY